MLISTLDFWAGRRGGERSGACVWMRTYLSETCARLAQPSTSQIELTVCPSVPECRGLVFGLRRSVYMHLGLFLFDSIAVLIPQKFQQYSQINGWFNRLSVGCRGRGRESSTMWSGRGGSEGSESFETSRVRTAFF